MYTKPRYLINHKADRKKLFILKLVRKLAGTPSNKKTGNGYLNII